MCTSLFRDLDPTHWRKLHHNPISVLSEIPLAEIESRAEEMVLHGRVNYAYRRQREYLNADRTWDARHAGVLRSAQSLTSRRNSDCTNPSRSTRVG